MPPQVETHDTPPLADAARAPARRASDAEALEVFLSARPSQCPACRYDLTEARNLKCPECGATLRLTLTAKRSAREAVSARLWLIGLVGPCTAVGVLTLEIARLAMHSLVNARYLPGSAVWGTWNRLLLLAGALLLMYFFVEMREAMSRLHPGIAMLMAQLAWVLAVGLLAVNQYVFV